MASAQGQEASDTETRKVDRVKYTGSLARRMMLIAVGWILVLLLAGGWRWTGR
jgi:fructose-1,6-bisphosphatase/inositol monophosphatase family enzyme